MTDEDLISAFVTRPSGNLLPAEAHHLVQRVKFVCNVEFRRGEVDFREAVTRVWTKLLINAKSFRSSGHAAAARSWLHTLIKRCILDEIKWTNRHSSASVELDKYLDQWHEPKLFGPDTPADEVLPPPGLASFEELVYMSLWISDENNVVLDQTALRGVFYDSLRAMAKDDSKMANVIMLSVVLDDAAAAARYVGVAPGTFANYVTKAKKIFRKYLPTDWQSLVLATYEWRKGDH